MRVGVYYGKAISLKVVAEDVASCFLKEGHQAYLMDRQEPPSIIRNTYDGAVFVIPFAPLFTASWFLIARELRKHANFPCIVYTMVEGRPIKRYIHNWMYSDITYIANSDFTKAMLESVGIEPTAVIPHGVNMEKVKSIEKMEDAGKSLVRSKFGVRESETVVFGVIASSHRRKGMDMFAEVVKKVTEADDRACFYILTPPEVLPFFSGIKNVYVNTGFGGSPNAISRKETLMLLSGFDFLIQPSLAESFCLPVLEAMAFGKPVIHLDYNPLSSLTTDDASIRVPVTSSEFVDTGEGIEYLMHFYDVNEFAEAILKAVDLYLNDENSYRKMCEKAKKRASEMDSNKIYKKLLKFLG